MTLYHYTCRHRALMIGRRNGTLTPHRQPLLDGLEVVWLTDLEIPDVDALGLTSTILTCDRTEVRYQTEEPAMRWKDWAEANHINRTNRSALELAGGAVHWFVSDHPVKVVRS